MSRCSFCRYLFNEQAVHVQDFFSVRHYYGLVADAVHHGASNDQSFELQSLSLAM